MFLNIWLHHFLCNSWNLNLTRQVIQCANQCTMFRPLCSADPSTHQDGQSLCDDIGKNQQCVPYSFPNIVNSCSCPAKVFDFVWFRALTWTSVWMWWRWWIDWQKVNLLNDKCFWEAKRASGLMRTGEWSRQVKDEVWTLKKRERESEGKGERGRKRWVSKSGQRNCAK